jgi:hypothetical protein
MRNPSDSPPKNGVQIYVPPKLASVLIAILLGAAGGGFGVTKLVNGSGADKQGKEPSKDNRNKRYNVRFELDNVKKTQGEHGVKIENLEKTTGEIQTVQHQNIARQDARRVTEKITNRDEREREFDRIYDLNMTRLKGKKPPCVDRRCRN